MRRRNEPPLSDPELRQIRALLREIQTKKGWVKIVLTAISHSVVIVALVVAYVVVTVTGNDGTPLLAVLGGYVGGAGIQNVTAGKKP